MIQSSSASPPDMKPPSHMNRHTWDKGLKITLTILVLLGTGLNAPLFAQEPVPAPPDSTAEVLSPPTPTFLPDGTITTLDASVNVYHNIPFVRRTYGVSGKGLTVAVVDTGINPHHLDFKDKIIHAQNFTDGDPKNADDYTGHGSHVASIIAAAETSSHIGAAPSARIVALKVIGDPSNRPYAPINDALKWLVEHHQEYRISVVNLSVGVGSNWTTDSEQMRSAHRISCEHIRALRLKNIAVVVAAGNSYHHHMHSDQQGMDFPAICRETISVGAMYGVDGSGTGRNAVMKRFDDTSEAYHAVRGRCTPFTQRLGERLGGHCRTDIFAAGFDVIGASGVVLDPESKKVDTEASAIGEVTDSGTSQSAPFISGLILLLQEHYQKINNTTDLPSVDLIEQALWDGGLPLKDEEDSIAQRMDNVVSSGETFRSAQAERTFEALANPGGKVTTPPHILSRIEQKKLVSDLKKKAELISRVRDGLPPFPDFKPNVRFYLSTEDQRPLAEQISTAAQERFTPLAIKTRLSPATQTKIEVRYFRYPEDSAVAVAMANLIKEQLNDTDSVVDLKPTDVAAKFPIEFNDPPEKPGDIEVWFPRQNRQN